MKHPGGRPTKLNKKTSQFICKEISLGNSLRSICKQEGMPVISTVMKWAAENKEFSEQYEKACNARAELMFDELLEIADDGKNDWMEKENKDGSTFTTLDHEHVQRSRLRVDTRKWYLSKVLPKKFGDKVDVTSDGKPIPLLHALHVSDNNSDEKDTSTQSED